VQSIWSEFAVSVFLIVTRLPFTLYLMYPAVSGRGVGVGVGVGTGLGVRLGGVEAVELGSLE
jgi:hypothetical protein